MPPSFPARASVVVVGGGVIGLSIAYHLARAGVRDVVLVERDELGLGLHLQGRRRRARPVLRRASTSSWAPAACGPSRRFAEDLGQEIDLHQVGYLFLLDRPEHVASFEANVALQNDLGVPSRMIDVAEAQALSPLISTDGLLAAAYSPDDGHCTPESVVHGYARAARRGGRPHRARLHASPGSASSGGSITAVVTDRGTIATDTVVCAAGAWSRASARWRAWTCRWSRCAARSSSPSRCRGCDPHPPLTIDFATSFYFHAEGPGLLLGMSDPDETPGFKPPDRRAGSPASPTPSSGAPPPSSTSRSRRGWAGLYEMTPDHNALIGEAAAVSRFLYATGFSGHGFLLGPAVGEVVRDLYLGRHPFVDVSPLTPAGSPAPRPGPELNIV